MKELLAEHGWLGATIIVLIQFVYSIWKDRSKEDRKILKQIKRDQNISFALLRVMSGDKFPEYIKRITEEKLLREDTED